SEEAGSTRDEIEELVPRRRLRLRVIVLTAVLAAAATAALVVLVMMKAQRPTPVPPVAAPQPAAVTAPVDATVIDAAPGPGEEFAPAANGE
ncbi:MAG: hypothetical protein H0X17_18020, partial [Deltaproteobacteria bacterium]|nr:hypothetical protein [Deltaproteobacteria bacterium]